MEYVIIGLLVVIVLLILYLVLAKPREQRIDVDLTKLENNLKNQIDLTMTKGMVALLEHEKENNNFQAQKFSELEKSINNRLDGRMDVLNNKLDMKLVSMNENVSKSLTSNISKTGEIYAALIERLTKIDEAQANINKLSNDVVSLKNVLENNQNRGKYGEYTLNSILFSVFGDAKEGVYATQYHLKGGNDVMPDSVIFLPQPYKLLCIDSKFPYADYKKIMENHNDDTYIKGFYNAVKKHITDVANKYIVKDETAPYAIMFVPSDAIFGYINGELYELVEFAREKNVVISSPSTLQPILANINIIKINYNRAENVEIISEQIKLLSKDFVKFKDDWKSISKNISALHNSTDNFTKRVDILNKKFEKINNTNNFETIENSDVELIVK